MCFVILCSSAIVLQSCGSSEVSPPSESSAVTEEENAPKKESIVRRLRPWVAAAAVVLAVLAVWFLFPFQSNEFATTPGMTEVVPLPDGSTVRLNAESEMRFDQPEGERRHGGPLPS